MAKSFQTITDELFAKVGAAELAEEIGCSLGAIKQARMDQSSPSYRQPPPGWEKAARALALAQAEHFTRLAAQLKDVG
jgi:hypothetical protein